MLRFESTGAELPNYAVASLIVYSGHPNVSNIVDKTGVSDQYYNTEHIILFGVDGETILLGY